MKTSQLIKKLSKLIEEAGDLDVRIFSDHSVNAEEIRGLAIVGVKSENNSGQEIIGICAEETFNGFFNPSGI